MIDDPTTAARRGEVRRVVFCTGKLYYDLSTGARGEPADGGPRAHERRGEVRRVVFCTGKLYYDLSMAEGRPAHVALVRVEELYPWPHAQVAAVLEQYPSVEDVVWAQEEPQNMGAWSYVSPRLRAATGNALTLRYVGRPERASPAEGYESAHKAEQARIVAEALAPVGAGAGAGRKEKATR